MEASWLLLVLSAAVFISVVLLTVVCLDCWNRGALGERLRGERLGGAHVGHSESDKMCVI